MTRVELIGAEYRVGAAYRFVQVDRLPEAQRVALGDFVRGPDVYAVLVPVRARAQTVKAIDHSTALLYLTLREPGRLPSSMQTALGDELPAVVARLVLDGVLEIRCGEDFVSGPDAASLLGVNIEPGTPRGRLAQLSHQALRYGQHLDIDDVQTLAGRLYAFNRSAVTSAWSRRLATREATARHLGLANDGSIGSHALGWVPQHGVTESSWLSWRSSARMHPDRDNAVYKLYLSPHVSAVAESLRITAAVVHKRGALGLKVGADAAGLFRPDKLVAYFTSFEDLGEAAASLAPRLAGMPAHGVPFTAEVSPDGLLSWGVDPPRRERMLVWTGESWRLWVVGRLASALVAARTASEGREPWRYALERIALEGIDPSTWVPRQQIFAAADGT